jgi:hypothetical protein
MEENKTNQRVIFLNGFVVLQKKFEPADKVHAYVDNVGLSLRGIYTMCPFVLPATGDKG